VLLPATQCVPLALSLSLGSNDGARCQFQQKFLRKGQNADGVSSLLPDFHGDMPFAQLSGGVFT